MHESTRSLPESRRHALIVASTNINVLGTIGLQQLITEGEAIPLLKEFTMHMDEKSKKQLLLELEDSRNRNVYLEKMLIEHQCRAEEELRKSEVRLQLAVEASGLGTWDFNLVTGEIYFSPRWKEMLGYTENEIPFNYDEWLSRIHPDDNLKATETLQNYLDGRIPAYVTEYRLRHRDGSYRWVLSRGACLRDSEGRPYRMAGSHTDITDKKRVLEELRKNGELLRIILEALPVGVAVFNRDGIKILENKAWKGIWCDDESVGSITNYKGWFADSGSRITDEEWPVFKAFSKGVSEKKIIMLECFDGTKRTVNMFATPLKTGNEIIAGVSVIEDITQQKDLEQRLMQAHKMESIGILAGGVAHDFNNLLTAISGYGETVRDNISPNDELLQESIDQVLRASARAAELTRSLLAFSRKQPINPETLLVDEIIDNTGKLIKRIIGEDIEFSTRFSDVKLQVMADRGQIEQVLMNLATNARDAMPQGGRFTISSRQVEVESGTEALYDLPSHGKYVVISVTDTGTGIDHKTMERIFEPFFTTKEVGKGTGLGLSITYGIIKQHNGSILVKSSPGKGTTFTIYLPTLAYGIQRREFVLRAPLSAGRETLLVAEDEDVVRVFLKNILERAGYSVITARDGEEGLIIYKQHMDGISLVLSDVVMPKMNGKELFKEIRKIKPDMKFIFISGYTADLIQEKGILEEGIECITKPFKKDDLLRKLRYMLDRG